MLARPLQLRWPVVAAIGALLVFAPTPARAHGIGSEAADKSVLEFVPIGIEHMLLGWDHVLFVAGVLLVASQVRVAAKMISLFALGHSTTLIAATLAGWRIDPEAVDIVIALSVVVVAVIAILGRPQRLVWFGAVVLGFGLVHGLGLATRFQDLGIPEAGQLWRVIAFNIGIEIGQIMVIFAVLAIGLLVATIVGNDREPTAVKLAAAALIVGGSVGASMVTYQMFTEPDEITASGYNISSDVCTVADRTESLPARGDHASKKFFEPSEEAPLGDFGHSVGDGYVAVLYPTQLQDPDLQDLRAFVTNADGALAGSATQVGSKVIAITADKQLTCDELDVDALTQFKEAWFASR
ncbi:HupE/UreJ family protein [Nocardioides sp. NPDC059952]|uniref:HupE/UreJ family protein n=1 Tax=Nocardioides sp. NPDC059952 TaxID=3347014 RepID=UPI0036596AAE